MHVDESDKVDIPLGLEHRLNDVLGARRQSETHAGVRPGALVQTFGGQLLDDLVTCREPVHAVVPGARAHILSLRLRAACWLLNKF